MEGTGAGGGAVQRWRRRLRRADVLLTTAALLWLAARFAWYALRRAD